MKSRPNISPATVPFGRFPILLAALVLHSFLIQDSIGASFFITSPMNRARHTHTATLLSNGKVLVVGGYDSTVTELFDPVTQMWSMTGRLNASRSDHRATLLPNGKVLVAGGVAGGPGSSAELYDPVTGTWAFTGPMQTAREAQTSTLLPNGKVLVAGGFGIPCCTSSLASAELYDPATGTWTFAGSMNTPRDNHTATLLPNGKVLVAGGFNRSGADNSGAELYDPITQTWTVTGSLSQSFAAHTATLLPDGKVLVAGGCPCLDIGSNNVRNAEVYDPATGTWTPLKLLITGRGHHTATALADGRVLVTGGYSAPPQSTAELFAPSIGIWTPTATMSTGRWWHTATLLTNGNVLVTGGAGASGSLSSAEIYQPEPLPSLTILRNAAQTISLSWRGAGTLEQSDSLTTTNWASSPLQDNPQILSTTGAMKFFRVKAQ